MQSQLRKDALFSRMAALHRPKTVPIARLETGRNRFLKAEKTTEKQNPRNIWVPGVLEW